MKKREKCERETPVEYSFVIISQLFMFICLFHLYLAKEIKVQPQEYDEQEHVYQKFY